MQLPQIINISPTPPVAQSPSPPVPSPHRPIVIGGGVSGIAAAVELATHGARPLLLESRPYLGGRVRSFIHDASGDEIDNGQHLMMGCYHATFDLLEKLGTRDLVRIQPTLRVAFRDRDGSSDLLAAPAWLPSPLDILAGLLHLDRLSIAERLGMLRVAMDVKLRRGRTGETVADYLVRLGQSHNVRTRLWDPIAIATLNMPPDEASSLLFRQVLKLAFFGSGDDAKLAVPRVGLSRLLEPATGYIEQRGGDVYTSCRVRSITWFDGRFSVVTSDGRDFTTDRLILAMPARMIGPLLTDQSLAGKVTIPQSLLDGSPIVSLYLWLDRSAESVPEICAMIGTGVQWVFNRRKIAPTPNPLHPGLLSCTISAANEQAVADADALAQAAFNELQQAFPELRKASVVDSLVIKERHATFAATPENEPLRPGPTTAVPGLTLAGDWTNTGLPATIEGAVRSVLITNW